MGGGGWGAWCCHSLLHACLLLALRCPGRHDAAACPLCPPPTIRSLPPLTLTYNCHLLLPPSSTAAAAAAAAGPAPRLARVQQLGAGAAGAARTGERRLRRAAHVLRAIMDRIDGNKIAPNGIHVIPPPLYCRRRTAERRRDQGSGGGGVPGGAAAAPGRHGRRGRGPRQHLHRPRQLKQA